MIEDERALRELEQCRCDALGVSDLESLKIILAPTYRHIHANGRVDDLDTYLNSVSTNPRSVERRQLDIRVNAEYAELLGRQLNTFSDRVSELVVYQIAGRSGASWQFLSTVVIKLQG